MATKVTTEEWIEELKSISVLELSERIKALEEEFGVSATAVAAAAPAAGAPAAEGGQGVGGRGAEAGQGGSRARGGREAQVRDRGGRRQRRAEVAPKRRTAELAGAPAIIGGLIRVVF